MKKLRPNLYDTHKQTRQMPKKAFCYAFLKPKYWGIWLLLLLLLPWVFLPLSVQFWLGRNIGKLVFMLAKQRKKDTLTNLSLAFNMDENTRYNTARQVFINQGIGIFESLSAWYRPNVFAKSFTISGMSHIVNAQKQGRAVILLGAHFTTLDLSGRLAAQFFAFNCVYRPQNNALVDWLIYNARRKIFNEQIDHKDVKALARVIKNGEITWYTPDQDFGLAHGIMAPFFGVDAATITAGRRLAKMGDKKNPPVVMMADMMRTSGMRTKKGRARYHLCITPLQNYPSNDEYADACYINQKLEKSIRKDICQWMWFHRRYKTQASGKNYYQ